MIEQIYLKNKIEYNERTEEWTTLVDGDRHSSKSLKEIKTFIDKRIKKKFKRFNVFVHDNYRGDDNSVKYTEATVTSVNPSGNAYLVKKGEKTAERFWRFVYSDTEKNRSLITEINTLNKQKMDLERRIKDKEKEMAEIDLSKVAEDFFNLKRKSK